MTLPPDVIGEDYFTDEEIHFIAEGIAARKWITLLSAKEGMGKSSLCLYLMKCVTSGGKFLGLETSASECVYFNLDRLPTTVLRELCTELSKDEGMDWLKNVHWQESPINVIEAQKEMIERYQNIGLIIIDTFAKLANAAGLDENSTQDMSRLMDALINIARESNSAILILHHISKYSETGITYRGSSVIAASSDIVLTFDGQNGLMGPTTLDVTKSRSHIVQHFPIQINDIGFSHNVIDAQPGEPLGSWKGILKNVETTITLEDWDRQYFYRIIEAVAPIYGDNCFYVNRQQLKSVFLPSINTTENFKRLNKIITTLRTEGTLEFIEGNPNEFLIAVSSEQFDAIRMNRNQITEKKRQLGLQ